jgi:hypothetical protein
MCGLSKVIVQDPQLFTMVAVRLLLLPEHVIVRQVAIRLFKVQVFGIVHGEWLSVAQFELNDATLQPVSGDDMAAAGDE